MRVNRLEKLDTAHLAYRLHFDDQEQKTVEVQLLRAFDNGWWLFHLEQPIMGRTFTTILVDRDGAVSVPALKREPFTLKPAPKPCRWCAEGNPRIESSVTTGVWIHTDTPMGRQVCTEGPPRA